MADALVPVCDACHRVLTRHQYDHGIVTRRSVQRGPLDQQRALIVGFVDLLAVTWRRDGPASAELAEAMETIGQLLSTTIDLLGPADRPGRFMRATAAAAGREPLHVAAVQADDGSDVVRLEALVKVLTHVDVEILPVGGTEQIERLAVSVPLAVSQLNAAADDPKVQEAYRFVLPAQIRWARHLVGFAAHLVAALDNPEAVFDEEWLRWIEPHARVLRTGAQLLEAATTPDLRALVDALIAHAESFEPWESNHAT